MRRATPLSRHPFETRDHVGEVGLVGAAREARLETEADGGRDGEHGGREGRPERAQQHPPAPGAQARERVAERTPRGARAGPRKRA